ncbi:MAG: YlbL family protein [Jatrophihabitantaceae bacterium]
MTQPPPPPKWWAVPGARPFARLSRRVRALLVATVVFLVLFILALTMPVPYVVLSPGPTYNTLGSDDSGNQIIVINGKKANATTGHLNMTTVDVSTAPLTAFGAVVGWLKHDEVVVPKASVFPPGQSEQQVNQQNTQDFTQSQDSAIAAAACQLGYPQRFGVLSVNSAGASYKLLKPSDLFRTVAGQPADTSDKLTTILQKQTPGTKVPVVVLRDGKPKTVTIALGQPLKGRTGASLGIAVSPDICQLPFEVDLGLGNQIGGPSAGLMFALGIMDKVGTADLTKGRFIAGTGTIDPSGSVGPIGGIQLKMIAARHAGATVFLAPAGNCADVRGATPSGLDVIKVQALKDAVRDLAALQDGQGVPHC